MIILLIQFCRFNVGNRFWVSNYCHSTLGGTSVIARIISKYSEMKTSQALLILDAIIVLSFIVVLPITNVLYTIVMLFIVEKSMSFVVEGFNPKKL